MTLAPGSDAAARVAQIEMALRALPQVRDAAVVARATGQGAQQLVAYVVTDGSFDSERMHGQVDPEVAVVVRVPELPKTAAGGIDREKLAMLRAEPEHAGKQTVATHSEIERRIAGFWREVLPDSHPGSDDDLFEVGGDSLVATQIAARIQDAFQVQLSPRTLLDQSTQSKLASVVERHLSQGQTKAADAIESVDAKSVLARLDQLSDEQVAALLKETLDQREGE